MEGRIVLMSVLLVSLVLGQIQVEAMAGRIVLKSCCPTMAARNRYDLCRATPPICAQNAGCILIQENKNCPSDYPYHHDNLENTGDDAVIEYCKLGCVSSACAAITTLQNSDASKVVNGAVEKCTNACSAFCTKGSISAVETA